MGNKLDVKRKMMLLYSLILVVIEVIVFLLLKDSGAVFSMIAGMLLIPVSMVMVFLMFSSLERAILISLFAIPVLPLTGYILSRLNMLDYQYLVYLAFYLISAGAMLKNGLLKSIDSSQLIVKNKVVRMIFALLLFVNIIFAYDKQLAFMIVALSFIPFSIYMYIVKTLKVESRKMFFDKVVYSICLGITVASIPDVIFFIINWVGGDRGVRGYGPLTGNYILVYDIIALVICLNKWIQEKSLRNKWILLVASLLCFISTQFSRGGYVTFIAAMVALIIFNRRQWKKYLPIFLIGLSCLSYNVMNRAEVAEDNNVQQIKEIIIDRKDDSVQNNSLITKILMSQSVTRQAIWGAAIDITSDYPYCGIGLGSLKYFYDDYTKGKPGYTDAHNLFLNISSELGLPFAILSIILLFYILIVEFINYIKTNDAKMKIKRLTLVVISGTIFLYGNLTGIPLELTVEVYSFNSIFVILALLTYRDCIELN